MPLPPEGQVGLRPPGGPRRPHPADPWDPAAECETLEYRNPAGEVVRFRTLIGTVGRFMPPIGVTTIPTPAGHGSHYLGSAHLERPVVVPVAIPGPLDGRAELRRWAQVLDPSVGEGTLTVVEGTWAGRRLRCVYEAGLDEWAETNRRVNAGTLLFRAAWPYWEDSSEFTVDVDQDDVLHTWFPFLPLIFGASDAFSLFTVDNTGDVDAWPVITVTGPAEDVTVTNLTTGASWTVGGALLPGSVLVVDHRPGQKTVRVDGVNAFDRLAAVSLAVAAAAGGQPGGSRRRRHRPRHPDHLHLEAELVGGMTLNPNQLALHPVRRRRSRPARADRRLRVLSRSSPASTTSPPGSSPPPPTPPAPDSSSRRPTRGWWWRPPRRWCSAPVPRCPLERQTGADGDLVTFTGVDDLVYLRHRLAHPEPATAAPPYNTQAFDTRTGSASVVIAEFVDANAGARRRIRPPGPRADRPGARRPGTRHHRLRPLPEPVDHDPTPRRPRRSGHRDPGPRVLRVRPGRAHRACSPPTWAPSPGGREARGGPAGQLRVRGGRRTGGQPDHPRVRRHRARWRRGGGSKGSTTAVTPSSPPNSTRPAQEVLSGIPTPEVQLVALDTPSQQFITDWQLGDQVTVAYDGQSVVDVIRQVVIRLEANTPPLVTPTLGGAP